MNNYAIFARKDGVLSTRQSVSWSVFCWFDKNQSVKNNKEALLEEKKYCW